MYRVEYDSRANRLLIHVSGFLTPEDVPALAAAVGSKASAARAIRDDFDTIVESFDFAVQANDVADLLSVIMRSGMALTSGRTAVVTGGHLGKLQAKRTLAHPRLKVFLSMKDAEDWLASDAEGEISGR